MNDLKTIKIRASAPITLEAKSEGKAVRKFSMVAYTGAAMDIFGWSAPVVVDLAGLKATTKPRPILKDHDSGQIVGHTSSVKVEGHTLLVEGAVSGGGAIAQEVITASDNGFPWQASIGARVNRIERIAEGQEVEANGRSFQGPLIVAREMELGEISFVALGADDETEARVAANKSMNEPEKEKSMEDEAGKVVTLMRQEASKESERIAAIRKVCGTKHVDIEAKAIAEGWEATKVELEVLRAERPTAPAVHPHEALVSGQVLEAAVCQSSGLQALEKKYSEETLDKAHKSFRGQISLQELLLEAARMTGYSARSFRADMRSVLEAAFSTFTLPGILSNIANKFLLEGFEGVESTWRSISATRSVKDFKLVTSYRLTGSFQYEEVGPDGELKHAEVGEESFTNQAKTYGKMFSLTRHDLINDDLGALTVVPRRLGRGAALKLNDVFWRRFLDNAAFFTVANKNYAAGATTALAIDALTQAEQMFLDQVDPDGHPLAITPTIILVPNGLLVTASQLMNSTEIREDGNTSKVKFPTNNPHAGKFQVVRSSYLANALYTGNSAKAWYLLANPADLPAIEVAFLNGQERPVVESADADFNVLGIQMRGYHDFGCNLQDPRGAVKMKGEV